MRGLAKLVAGAALLPLMGGLASAHHSFAMFDISQGVTLDVVVEQWAFNNPHVWLYGMVMNADGNTERWGFEGPGVVTLLRSGMTGDTFKPGDKLRVVICPLRDGRRGGELAFARTHDGKIYTPVVGGCPGPAILSTWQKQGWIDSDKSNQSHPVPAQLAAPPTEAPAK